MIEYKSHNATIEQVSDDMHIIYNRLSNALNAGIRDANTYETITQYKEELEQLNKDFQFVYDALNLMEHY